MLLNSVINSGLTLVIDADGLNMIAGSQVSVPQSILTPHPGEAARLLGCDTDEIQARRHLSARRIQDLYGGVCMLKGPGTLICLNGGELWLCDRGNPGMATAGMGDVLSGVIGGLLAQGLSVESAAKSGAWLHSTAADLADYYPEFIEADSHMYYGKNAKESMDMMANKVGRYKKDLFYDYVMEEASKRTGGAPRDLEDVMCDYIRYIENYIPSSKQGTYDHLDRTKVWNTSAITDHPKGRQKWMLNGDNSNDGS